MNDLISRQDAIEAIELVDCYHQIINKDMVHGANDDEHQAWYKAQDIYEALEAVPSAEAVPQSEQYKKGFEDAKRAFLVEYARESRNMRKRQLEVMLNAQKAILADRPKGEWIRTDFEDCVDGEHIKWARWNCSECGVEKKIWWVKDVNFCPNCGADMRGNEK